MLLFKGYLPSKTFLTKWRDLYITYYALHNNIISVSEAKTTTTRVQIVLKSRKKIKKCFKQGKKNFIHCVQTFLYRVF